MGYAAFGGDIALGQDYTVGAAFQYGKGTLRSAVSSIRNEIDSYGFALYGAKTTSPLRRQHSTKALMRTCGLSASAVSMPSRRGPSPSRQAWVFATLILKQML